jgi:OOP family OmpA-OmpF porin
LLARFVAVVVLTSSVAFAADPKPPSFITPYPGQKLYTDPKVKDFDEHYFIVGKTRGEQPPGAEFKKVEGKVTELTYEHPQGRSSLEVAKNFEQGLKQAGFEIVYSCANKECGRTVAPMPTWDPPITQWVAEDPNRYLVARLNRPEGTAWVAVYINLIGNSLDAVHIVEEKPMDTGMIKVDAAALKKGLEDNGFIAIYGIVFDTGKATLKPESAAALEEVKKLLDGSPKLKLYVVGHTDDVGSESSNVTLSNQRAAAVVRELTTKYKIAKDRLKSAGVGPYVPVASNKSDEGRAKNRRVVLVEDVP